MRTTVDVAAANRDPVLIIGETPEARVLTAWFIHGEVSTQRPFIRYRPLRHAQGNHMHLFGFCDERYRSGETYPGMLEQAYGGTVLLDDIEAIELAVQDALERFLRYGTIRRWGETEDRHVAGTRLMTGTARRDLSELVRAERFRPWLWERLTAQTVYTEPAE
jgi:arginine utilization regulatory protein